MFQVIILAGAALLIGIDQLTKWLAVSFLKGEEPFTVIPGAFELTYVENRGAAFGIGEGQRWLLVTVTLVVMLFILGLLLSGKFRKHKWITFSGILIVGGGMGNLIDRLFRGYVVDFFHVKINFPVFNVADCCVVVGAIILLIYFFFFYDDTPASKTMKKSGISGKTNTDDELPPLPKEIEPPHGTEELDRSAPGDGKTD